MNSPRSATTQSRNFTKTAASPPPLSPADLPLVPATLDDLAGGDAETNAGIIRSILAGDTQGPKREAVLLNTGAALFVANAADSISAGMDLAATVIDDGRARQTRCAKQLTWTANHPSYNRPLPPWRSRAKVGGNSYRYWP